MTQIGMELHAPTEATWTTAVPQRHGTYRYLHLVRSPDDPERSARRARTPSEANTRWRDFEKASTVEDRAREILAHLSDGVPRTFNRIGVELWDQTADVMLDRKPDHALWLLLERGLVERTERIPIYWRATR